MSNLTVTATRIRGGIWNGVITSDDGNVPQIVVHHLDKPVPDIKMVEDEDAGRWHLQVPIPAEAIADGVQTFVISDPADGTRLAHFTLIAGEVLGDDFRAEMELLRAELDMLKRAFRRHCVETS